MYVCICLAVTDGQVRRAIDGGACTRKQLVECLGVGRVCGKCNDEVKALLMGASCGTGACGSAPPPAGAFRQGPEPIHLT
jgi:bacterioferritin-associated ferredoxin